MLAQRIDQCAGPRFNAALLAAPLAETARVAEETIGRANLFARRQWCRVVVSGAGGEHDREDELAHDRTDWSRFAKALPPRCTSSGNGSSYFRLRTKKVSLAKCARVKRNLILHVTNPGITDASSIALVPADGTGDGCFVQAHRIEGNAIG